MAPRPPQTDVISRLECRGNGEEMPIDAGGVGLAIHGSRREGGDDRAAWPTDDLRRVLPFLPMLRTCGPGQDHGLRTAGVWGPIGSIVTCAASTGSSIMFSFRS